MKYPVIVHKEPSWTSPYAPDYQDETSDLKQKHDVSEARRLNAVDYLSKEEQGQVIAGGFMRDLIARNPDGTFSNVEKLSNTERKKRLVEAWNEHARRFAPLQITHHRLEFSMARAFHDLLIQSRLNPDSVLHDIMKKAMRHFTERFHPGDSIGYSYGFHHDTDNLHVHVFVHPRTAKGQRVGISSGLKNRTDKQRRHQLTFLKQSALVQAQRWVERCENPLKQQELVRYRQGHRFFIEPRLAPSLDKSAEYNQRVARLQQIYADLGVARRQIDQLKTLLDNQKTIRSVGRIIGWSPRSAHRLVSRIGVQAAHENLRQLREQYFDLRQHYLSEYRQTVALKPRRGRSIRVGQAFRPEFVGRLDEKLVFERLSNGIQRQIAGVMLERELERLAGLGYQLKPSPLVVEVLVRQGISKTFGARPLRQTVERLLGEAICHALKEGRPASGLLRVDTTRRFLLIEPLKGVSSHESRKERFLKSDPEA